MREAYNPFSWKGYGIGLGANGDQCRCAKAHNLYSWKGSGIGLGAKGDQCRCAKRTIPSLGKDMA